MNRETLAAIAAILASLEPPPSRLAWLRFAIGEALGRGPLSRRTRWGMAKLAWYVLFRWPEVEPRIRRMCAMTRIRKGPR